MSDSRISYSSDRKVTLSPFRESPRLSGNFSFYEYIGDGLNAEEEKDMIVYKVRDELVKTVIDGLHEKYLQNQTFPFTVNCFAKALREIINCYFLPRDPGDLASDWHEDDEPPSVPVDNWGSYSVSHVDEIPSKFQFQSNPPPSEKEQKQSRIERSPSKSASIEDKSDFRIEKTKNKPKVCSRTSSRRWPPTPWNKNQISSPAVSKITSLFESSDTVKSKSFCFPWSRQTTHQIDVSEFPEMRVTAGVYFVPGEAVSSKTCSMKTTVKTFNIKSHRSYSF